MTKGRTFPSWLAREKARNLESLKSVDQDEADWKSFGDCAAANTKRMLILLRDAASDIKDDPTGWRICQVRCLNSIRQIVRLHQNRWQVRSYIETRRMRMNRYLGNLAETLFTVRAYTEVSRMTKYLALERKNEHPPIYSWSQANKRAYEKINYFLKDEEVISPWAACLQRINLLNLHFHRTTEWERAFEGRIKAGLPCSLGSDR